MAGPDRAGAAAAGRRLRARSPALRRRLRPVVRVARRPNPGSRSTPPSSCCAPAMPARRSPTQALIDALKFIAGAADEPGDKPEDLAAQAYRLYVLALRRPGASGRGARAWPSASNALPTPLAKAQLGAALALAHDQPRAEAAFAAALAAPGAQMVGVRLRHRAARPGGDRRAAEGERPAGRSAGAADRRDAGRRSVARHAVTPRSRPGPRRPPRCWAATARRRTSRWTARICRRRRWCRWRSPGR